MITQYEDWLIREGHWDESHPRWIDWKDQSGENWKNVGAEHFAQWKIDEANKLSPEQEAQRLKYKPYNSYIDKDGNHRQTRDQKKVGRDFSKPGNPFYGDWSQELVDEVYTFDRDKMYNKESGYGWTAAYPQGVSSRPGYQPWRLEGLNYPEYTDEDGQTYLGFEGHSAMQYPEGETPKGEVRDYNYDGVIDESDELDHRLLPEYRPSRTYDYYSNINNIHNYHHRNQSTNRYFPYADLVKRYMDNVKEEDVEKEVM